MNARARALALLGVGAILGAAIWLFSPWLTGRAEPWDADFPLWGLSWLLIGVAGGLVGRLRGLCLPVGYALGQMLLTIQSLFTGPFGALGWMFIAGYAGVSVSLAGAIIGVFALRRRFQRPRG
ncbi:MAG: hypothetical protein WA210_17500 [Burkholderiaceae bacterium]